MCRLTIQGTLSVILREYDVEIADLTFQARIERFIAQTRTASEGAR